MIFLFDGPSFQNFVFHLKSSINAPNHTLTITSQTSVNTNFAFIQGTWQGEANHWIDHRWDGLPYGFLGEWNGGH